MRGWRWNRAKEELSEELEAHLRMAVEDRMARGESASAARAASLRELGNVPLIEDVTRERWGWLWLENALHDSRYALRQLQRSPGFTATVLLTLALGIGANLAVFQLLYSVILAKLPVAHPEELVTVHAARTPFDQAWSISYAAYWRLRAAANSQAPLAARTAMDEAILQTPGDESMPARYEMVSDNYFAVLGVSAAAGREFVRADAKPGQSEWPAVVRYDFARAHFGSAQQAVGKHVKLNQVPALIVGVADRRFAGMTTGYAPDFWLPLEAEEKRLGVAFDSLGPGHGIDLDRAWVNQPGIFWLTPVARIAPDRRQAMAGEWERVFRADRELMTQATVDPAAKAAALRATIAFVSAEHGAGGIRKQSTQPLLLLMALSASIFLIGCLNLASLQWARLHARAHELGVRMALGANRWRLVSQILVEDAMLVLLGGAAAFLVGRAASGILVRWASSRGGLLHIDLHPDVHFAALDVGLTLVALCAFSILPALYFVATNLAQAAGSRGKIAGLAVTRGQRWRAHAMLAAQVSMSLVLTAMSGCFAATLIHWETVDLGMDREHVLSVSVDMQRTGYATRRPDWPALYRDLRRQLAALPQVRDAAVEMCPMPECGWNTALYVFGRGGLSNAQVHGEEDHVGPGFFSTMGIPLLQGRNFTDADTDATQAVALVNRSYARQLFGNENPVGHWVGYEPAPHDRRFLIVGEVADARQDGPQRDAPATVYMSIDQHPFPIHTIQVRVAGDPEKIAGTIRDAIRRIDADLPITDMAPLETEMNDGLGTEKLLARLAAVYAALTLLMVGIGFYGVMSWRSTQRKSEFGIRLALGAKRRQIHALVIGQTVGILVAGSIPGLLLSLLAIRWTRHLLFGSTEINSAAVLGAAIVLALAALLATLVPSYRASLADPLETLRSE